MILHELYYAFMHVIENLCQTKFYWTVFEFLQLKYSGLVQDLDYLETLPSLWMRSSRVVRASDFHCESRNNSWVQS